MEKEKNEGPTMAQKTPHRRYVLLTRKCQKLTYEKEEAERRLQNEVAEMIG